MNLFFPSAKFDLGRKGLENAKHKVGWKHNLLIRVHVGVIKAALQMQTFNQLVAYLSIRDKVICIGNKLVG